MQICAKEPFNWKVEGIRKSKLFQEIMILGKIRAGPVEDI